MRIYFIKLTKKNAYFLVFCFQFFNVIPFVFIVKKHMLKGKRTDVKKALSRQEMDDLKRKKEMKEARFGGIYIFQSVAHNF